MSSPQVSPLVVVALIAAALLLFVIWRRTVRRPVEAPAQGEAPPLVVAAIWATDVPGFSATDAAGGDWVDSLVRRLPGGSRLLRFERTGLTIREAKEVEVPQVIAAQPGVILLWCCVHDATGGTPLSDYMAKLQSALTRFVRESKATVALLNLPDITVLAGADAEAEKRALVQGGLRQWNDAIATTAMRFGERVRLVDLYPASEEILGRPGGNERLADLVASALRSR